MTVLSVFLLALVGCSDDIDKIKYNPEDVVLSVIEPIKDAYVLTKEDQEEPLDVFKWSKTELNYSAALTYILQADLAGQEFKHAQDIASSKTNQLEVITGNMNLAMAELQEIYGFQHGEPQEVEFRIQAVISPTLDPLYSSNTLKASITSYSQNKFADALYMIGESFGGWDWSSPGVVEMIPVNGMAGKFWTIKYLEASSPFKWNSQLAWGGDFASLGSSYGFEEKDGNAVVEESGLYMIFIDQAEDLISIEPAQVFGIGDAFGGWAEGKYPLSIQGKEASIQVSHDGALRLYTTNTYAKGIDWWRMEFVLRDGILEYRGNGDDLEPVEVHEGELIRLDFTANTGTIE